MPDTSYEIRICQSCGLRYPLVQGHPFGTRCPACMGGTRVTLRRQLAAEPDPASHSKGMKRMRSALNKVEREEERGKSFAVLLDNIRSAWNVGSILRSADGFGFTHAYLCGITPLADNEAVAKTSLGAEDSVPWSYHKDAVRLIKGLKAEGWKVYALEEDPRSLSISQLTDSRFPNPTVLIVGNEVSGVDPDLLDLCDSIVYIPMFGEKKSFNVAIAFGIAAYALNAQRLGT
ncbi:MAG TPA: RNA methyltransferase [Anaerolineales bacterium]|nr:RNA methyltransferase [Anaerolineales bacterium]